MNEAEGDRPIVYAARNGGLMRRVDVDGRGKLNVDQALEAVRRGGGEYRADEERADRWHATCPLCVGMSTTDWPLTVHEQGVEASVDCVNGCDRDEVMRALRAQLPAPTNGHRPEVPYEDGPAGLVWLKSNDERVPLTNFPVRIVADTAWDDGSGEVRRAFTLEARLGNGVQRLDVPATSFATMAWVAELGAGAYLEPGPLVKDRARHAIQVLSRENVAQRRVFAHTGWRELPGGGSVWLHAGGAIGHSGPVEGIEVSLPRELEPMQLPDPPEGEELRTDVRHALELLDVGPDDVTVPILGGTYRAPLGDAGLTVHVAGATGVFKSELAALAQQHYGAGFDARHLPGSWSSTANSAEMLAFTAKDALLVVDDFAPSGSSTDISRAHSAADRLLRGQGNHSGRGRLRSDGTMRPSKPPRGLILSTGEDIPRGQSLRARMVVLELRHGDIDSAKLVRVQDLAADGVYAGVMSAYLSWLAKRPFGELKATGARRERQLRDVLAGAAHARIPDNIAKLAAGLETFLAFAVDVGAIASPHELWERCWTALLGVAAAQAEHQAAADHAARFLHLLSGAIISGRAHVADAQHDREPDRAAAWGWREDTSGRWTVPPTSARIGWADGDDVYLDRQASYSAAQRAADEAGQALAVEPGTLHKRLRDGGWLILGQEAEGRLTVRRTLGGVRNRRVLHLRADAVLAPRRPMSQGPGGSGAPGTVPAFRGGFMADSAPGATRQPGERRDRPGACSRSAPGPKRQPGALIPSADGRFGQDAPGSPGSVAQ